MGAINLSLQNIHLLNGIRKIQYGNKILFHGAALTNDSGRLDQLAFGRR